MHGDQMQFCLPAGRGILSQNFQFNQTHINIITPAFCFRPVIGIATHQHNIDVTGIFLLVHFVLSGFLSWGLNIGHHTFTTKVHLQTQPDLLFDLGLLF